jgi:hypothetical protein
MKLSGEAGDLNFAIGGIVSPNLALHAMLYGWLVQDLDVEDSAIRSNGISSLVVLKSRVSPVPCPTQMILPRQAGLPDSDDSPKAGGPARLV